jgi:serine/threonine protein kinase
MVFSDYENGEIIDGQYIVRGVCSESGGMGSLLFVNHTSKPKNTRLVLKYCKQKSEEALKRFQREVRLMEKFKGNRRVVQILHSNVDYDPPYFVMRYFPDGDLTRAFCGILPDFSVQEIFFNQMIDCVGELHSQNIFHRDIKPQNFLLDNGAVVVSDLGLSIEIDSATAFTHSSVWAGTKAYLPPEFLRHGGFKHADASGDIFMLGKSFYSLLSGQDPTYPLPDGIPGPLFAVIERCCAIDKERRYVNLSALKQSLTSVYDVLCGRVVGPDLASRTLQSIMDRLKATSKYSSKEIRKFIDELSMLSDNDMIQICLEISTEFFDLLRQKSIESHLCQFLKCYRKMVEDENYGYGFAETIADHMKILFLGTDVSAANKAESLRIAIIAALNKNRFAAMDTCQSMIMSVTDAELGQRVHDVMMEFPNTFIDSIEESNCRSTAIRNALMSLRARGEEEPNNSDSI